MHMICGEKQTPVYPERTSEESALILKHNMCTFQTKIQGNRKPLGEGRESVDLILRPVPRYMKDFVLSHTVATQRLTLSTKYIR